MLWYNVDVTSAESSVLVLVQLFTRCSRDIITSDTFFVSIMSIHSSTHMATTYQQ